MNTVPPDIDELAAVLDEPLPTVAEALDPRRRTWWPAADLMATTFPEPRWAVPEMLAEGLTLLAGAPKLGKSWLVAGLAVAVAAGGKAFGALGVEQGDVLYLALEDHPRRMKDRLAKILGSDPTPRALTIGFEWDTEHVDEWLDRHGKRLLIIDVLARVRRPAEPGVPQYEQDYRVMRNIKNLADEHKLAVVAVHHTRKMGSVDFLDEVSGTNGLAGGADAVMVLKRMRGEAGAELHITGRDVAEAEYALEFRDGYAWTLYGGDLAKAADRASTVAATAGLADRTIDIISFVASKPEGVRAGDVDDKFGKGTRRYLARLVAAGKLTRPNRGIYSIPVSQLSQRPNTLGQRDGWDTPLGATDAPTCPDCGWPVDSTGHATNCEGQP